MENLTNISIELNQQFNTKEDIRQLIHAVEEIARG